MAEISGGLTDISEVEQRLKRMRDSSEFSFSSIGKADNSSMDNVAGVANDSGVLPNVESLQNKHDKKDDPRVSSVQNKHDKKDDPRVSSVHGVHGTLPQAPVSYAAAVSSSKSADKVMLRVLHNTERVDGSDVVIPLPSVKETSAKFENTLYGYFIGKRLAYPVVEQFVKNAWAKYGFKRSMMNGKGFFFFQFESKDGIDRVLEDGPWLIRNVPIIVDVWTPMVNLSKEGIKAVPLWVKLHDVPLVAFSEVGLSLLTTKIGKPKRLDGHTSEMCRDLWGRSSFARALVEVSSDMDLKEEIIVAIPSVDGEGYVKERVKLEYEWRPPRCSACCVFGHEDSKCPKLVAASAVLKPAAVETKAGYEVVNKYKEANRKKFPVKQNPKLIYRPVHPKKHVVGNAQQGDPKSNSQQGMRGPKPSMGQNLKTGNGSMQKSTSAATSSSSGHNRFSPLAEEVVDEFDEPGIEHIDMREAAKAYSEGASTPGLNGFNG